MSAEHKPRLIVRFRLSLLRILLHCVKVTWGNRLEGNGSHVIRFATRKVTRSACLLATTTDDGTGAGNVTTGTGIGTATGTETVVGTGGGAEEIGTPTHVGGAAPEVLGEVITRGVQVRTVPFGFSV